MRAAQLRTLGRIEPGHRRAEHDDLAAAGNVEAGEQVEQRRLAGAGGAGDGGELAGGELEREVAEDLGRARAAAVRLRQRERLRDDRAALAAHRFAPLRRRQSGSGSRRRDKDAVAGQLETRPVGERGAAQQLLGNADPAALVHDGVGGTARPALAADAAVADLHDAVGDGGGLRVVADDDRRHAGLA